jgi:hypothetical protein
MINNMELFDYSDFELTAMHFILDGIEPELLLLKNQFKNSTIQKKTYDGAGFFILFDVPEKCERLFGQKNYFVIDDVEAKVEGLKNGIGLILFIKNGVIDMLEGVTYDEPYPQNITSYSFYYLPDGKRNLDELRNKW